MDNPEACVEERDAPLMPEDSEGSVLGAPGGVGPDDVREEVHRKKDYSIWWQPRLSHEKGVCDGDHVGLSEDDHQRAPEDAAAAVVVLTVVVGDLLSLGLIQHGFLFWTEC